MDHYLTKTGLEKDCGPLLDHGFSLSTCIDYLGVDHAE